MDPTRKAKEHLQYVFKSCCIYYKRNVDHYPYCADTKHDMLEILKANSSEEINQIFGQIKMRNEDGIQNWLEYYQKPWVLIRKLSKRTTSKGKQRASKKAKINYDDDDTEMEIEERKIALEERKMQFKQNEIDLKLKELQIKKLEMELNNNQ
ncbi:unnamed protein product [Rhizophagus irregularis]|uniref:Uncharacterized protein n=1 Tax=Rhizophagus irregularis TaxID=588596 RepID=A0A915ZNT5_9GLOM|nr:unnamed protein product [Rhizophagus irregularis]